MAGRTTPVSNAVVDASSTAATPGCRYQLRRRISAVHARPVKGLAGIPDALSDAEAAPLLCAGVTTFNALRHSGALPGSLVAVQGIGGLGHLGIQFANKFG